MLEVWRSVRINGHPRTHYRRRSSLYCPEHNARIAQYSRRCCSALVVLAFQTTTETVSATFHYLGSISHVKMLRDPFVYRTVAANDLIASERRLRRSRGRRRL